MSVIHCAPLGAIPAPSVAMRLHAALFAAGIPSAVLPNPSPYVSALVALGSSEEIRAAVGAYVTRGCIFERVEG